MQFRFYTLGSAQNRNYYHLHTASESCDTLFQLHVRLHSMYGYAFCSVFKCNHGNWQKVVDRPFWEWGPLKIPNWSKIILSFHFLFDLLIELYFFEHLTIWGSIVGVEWNVLMWDVGSSSGSPKTVLWPKHLFQADLNPATNVAFYHEPGTLSWHFSFSYQLLFVISVMHSTICYVTQCYYLICGKLQWKELAVHLSQFE